MPNESQLFTVTMTYDRVEIMAHAERCRNAGSLYQQIKNVLDTFYLGWHKDLRTACMIEILLRKDDKIAVIYQEKLDELNKLENKRFIRDVTYD